MPRPAWITSIALLTLLGLLAACTAAESRLPRERERGVRDSPDAVVHAQLRRVLEAASGSEAVWPEFHLRAHVLVVAVLPTGPVYLIGDPAPPTEYTWVNSQRQIAARIGVPPDSLRRLGSPSFWNGSPRLVTIAPITAIIPRSRVASYVFHEAFHSHQAHRRSQVRDRFATLGDVEFPDTSVMALALLNLEGHFLADAIGSSDSAEAVSAARMAVAIRHQRCRTLGRHECSRQRALEQTEGTATYAAGALLGEFVRGEVVSKVQRDSLARSLTAAKVPERLRRGHYYDSGLAWLLLLDRFNWDAWEEQVESTAPDLVLAQMFGLTADAATDALFAAAVSTKSWAHARRSAIQTVNLVTLMTSARRTPVNLRETDRRSLPHPSSPATPALRPWQ